MNQRGFTLLESLIALALLSVTLVALIPTFQNFMDANTVSEERSNALAAAQETEHVGEPVEDIFGQPQFENVFQYLEENL